jgi:hypothetical protein
MRKLQEEAAENPMFMPNNLKKNPLLVSYHNFGAYKLAETIFPAVFHTHDNDII